MGRHAKRLRQPDRRLFPSTPLRQGKTLVSFLHLTSPDRIGAQLLAGDFEPILDRYATSITVFMPAGVHTLFGRSALRETLAAHRDGLLAEGVRTLVGRAVARSLRAEPMSVEFINWTYGFGDGRPTRSALAAYYVRRFRDGPRIEMIHYRSTAFESHADWHRQTAVSVAIGAVRSNGRH